MIPLSACLLCQEIKQQTVSGWMDSDGHLIESTTYRLQEFPGLLPKKPLLRFIHR